MSNYARAEMPAVYSYTEFTNYEFLIAKAIPHNSIAIFNNTAQYFNF